MWIWFVLLAIVCYLLGSVSPSYLIGKYIKKMDLRQQGSGNLGSTNVFRVLGARAAAVTFVIDTLKGFVSLMAADLIFGNVFPGYENIAMMIAGIAVFLGHNFPWYLGFKGGKGIATSFGVALWLNPIAAILVLALEWLITLTTGYVSLASIINCILFPFAVNLIRFGEYEHNIYLWILPATLGIIAIIRHGSNIKRLLQGKENKFVLTKTIKTKHVVFKDKDK